MPFPTQTPTPFTFAAVSALKMGQNGCYGLFKTGLWIYVGKGDIQARLLAHLGRDNPCITRNAPTHFVMVLTPDMDAVEKALILELAPVCNKKVG